MRWFIGLALMLVGIAILGDNVGWFDFSFGEFVAKFWPVILIALGVEQLVSHSRARKWSGENWTEFVGEKFSRSMGDVHLRPAAVDAAGLAADQGFGDISIDLTGTALQPGENRVYCNLGMGDIKVVVPANVPLRASAKAGVGDVRIFERHSGGFGTTLQHEDADYANADKKIFLTAKVGLGDVKITRA